MPFGLLTVNTMTPHRLRPTAKRVGAAVGTWLAMGMASAAPIPLAPQYAGSYPTGTGSDAQFVQIAPDWHGSTVLWNEATQSFGNRWAGQAASINYGNNCYNSTHSGQWGMATLLPFDNGACGSTAGNWTAHFSGFIRVADAGLYNFSVLYDDGFFFRLIGDGGQTLGIEQDFLNARDREGFAEDLQLSVGLYGFELGSWNRLQAGVVDLRWSRGDENWTLVPTENLLPGSAVDEPALPWLIAAASAAALLARRRRSARRA